MTVVQQCRCTGGAEGGVWNLCTVACSQKVVLLSGKTQFRNGSTHTRTCRLLALAFSQLLVFVLTFNMRKLSFLHENCCPPYYMPKTAPKTQCRYRFTALQAHTILCLQLPLPLKRFRFYSAAAKNDTLTIHRQLGMEMGAKGTHRYDGDVAAAAAVIIMVYLLLLWWWVSRWQRPISQLFGMIMKRRSMHTVVGAFASSITTTTIAGIATDIQINIASAKTHKMAKREERKTSREGKRWIETKNIEWTLARIPLPR